MCSTLASFTLHLVVWWSIPSAACSDVTLCSGRMECRAMSELICFRCRTLALNASTVAMSSAGRAAMRTDTGCPVAPAPQAAVGPSPASAPPRPSEAVTAGLLASGCVVAGLPANKR